MLKFIEETVRDAARIILEAEAKRAAGDHEAARIKSNPKDLVTEYDKRVQDFLFKALSGRFPDAGFLGEEQLSKPSAGGGLFIIDPIDGTTNFIKGLNHSAISVAWADRADAAGAAGKTVCSEAGAAGKTACPEIGAACGPADWDVQLAVIYDPYKDEMFTARKGHGAFLNGKPIHCSPEPMESAVAYFGTSPYIEDLRVKSFRLAAEITRHVIDTRRFGAATLDLCDLACGRAEIYVEYSLSPWDYAAGALIAKEAGVLVTDMSGAPLQYTEKSSLMAASPSLWPAVFEMVKSIG